MRLLALIAMVTAAASSSACATVAHQPISEQEDADAKGIRYYNSSPYLFAYSDGKGGLITEIRHLPDPAKLMSASPQATLADVGTTLEFSGGVLSSAKDSGDATKVSNAIAKAIETIGPALLGVLNDASPSSELQIPPPHIYKIVVAGAKVEFRGGPADKGFVVTLLPQQAKEK